MPDQNLQTTKSQAERRHSRLPPELQRLVDEEEDYLSACGDFENSWTSTRPKEEAAKAASNGPSSVDAGRQQQNDGTMQNMLLSSRETEEE
ncbi:hypothetical protein AnigIFM63604_007125 [Aspergillus niger]|uniref:Uncharacterized protein n=1 Tax=Aspergillus niger TaxID=5061 RepID=A0A9W6EH33_ASPNG|nr:hypothetical protein AnigIFM63604_007125 [Aspergillus niger]